jgi:DNA-directed RNA polymerase specialized sigma24 family protein
MGFARQAAGQFASHLDPDDAVQEVALHVLEKLRAGGEFGADGRTRNYVKTSVRWQASAQYKRARIAQAYARDATMMAVPSQPAVLPISASLKKAIASLHPPQLELLLRVAIAGDELTEISEEVAACRAAESGREWRELSEQQRAVEGGKAYQTVYRRFRRTCLALQGMLVAG